MSKLPKRINTYNMKRLAAMIAMTLPVGAIAQVNQPVKLADVVVSASGFEQNLKEAPASISVVTREELEKKQFRDLAEALSDVEGVDVHSSTGKSGGLSISIRGMPSDYTLFLIDGRRQNVAGDATPNGFGAALNSFIPPVSAIERIEVIRGPMSTLYGSDAMGGVVNIITRKVASEWGGSIGVEASQPEDRDFGDTRKINVYTSGPIIEEKLGLVVRGSFYDRDFSERIIKEGVGRDPAIAESQQHSVGGRLTFTPDQNNEIWLDLDRSYTWYNNEDCRLGTRDLIDSTDCDGPGTSYAGYKDDMSIIREQAVLGHKITLDAGVLESSLTRTETETLGRTLPSDAFEKGDARIGQDRDLETVNTLVDSKLVVPIGDAHKLSIGGQWWKSELVDSLLPERTFDQTIWAGFAENEWSFADDWKATFGVRYDEHDAFGGHVSPRAYLVWNATSNWTLKGGVSDGYKAPRINQLIDGVSGISGQGKTINIGNPNLEPETSRSKEISAIYDNQRGWSSSITLFDNDFKDKIVASAETQNCLTMPISSCSEVLPEKLSDTTYNINVDEAKTWGAELVTAFPLTESLSFKFNYTWTESELIQDSNVTGKLMDTPKHMANAQLRWAATEDLNVWLRSEYRGKTLRFSETELTPFQENGVRELGKYIESYHLLHLGGSYQVSDNVTLGASINNLLDKDFTKDVRSYVSNAKGAKTFGNDYFTGGSSISGVSHYSRTFTLSANFTF